MKLFCALFIFLVGCSHSLNAADGIISPNREDSNPSVVFFLAETKKAWDAYAKTTKRSSIKGFVRALKKVENGAILFNNISVSNADNMVMVIKVDDDDFNFAISNQKLKKLITSMEQKIEEPSKLFLLINETIVFGKMGLMELLFSIPESSVTWVERKLCFEDFELKTISGKKVKITEKLRLKLLEILAHLKDETIKLFKDYVTEAKKKSIKKP